MDPNQDFDQYVRDVVKDVVKTGDPANPQNPNPGNQGFKLNIAGQTFQYNNQAELEQALNNFVVKAGQTMTQLQEQANQNQQHPQPQNQQQFVQGDDAPAWNDEEFVKHMTESPKLGFEYAFNKLIFDGKSADPIGDLKQKLEETELTKRSIAAYQFKENHPEFPGGAQAAQRIDEIRQQLNLPYDYNGLEAAYLIGMQRGALPNFYQLKQQQDLQAQYQQAQNQGYVTQGQPAQQQPNQYVPQIPQGQGQMDPRAFNGGFGLINPNANPYMQAPPGVARGNASGPQNEPDYDSMSLDQLDQIVSRINQRR